MITMVEVTQEDAESYCRILAVLGMEEEGDPVDEIERMRTALDGLPDGALDGGWTARGIIEYAKKLEDAIAMAYGHLWHVNNEPMAPKPTYSPERAAYEARKILRDLLTHEQRGAAINKVQKLLTPNNK